VTVSNLEKIAEVFNIKFDYSNCFYCGSAGPFQMDHFPVPARHEGRQTVKACLHCHNLKDRISTSMFFDYICAQTYNRQSILRKLEIEFLAGADDIKSDDLLFLLGDIQEFETPIRLWIARRTAAFFDSLSYQYDN
jgi:hypothetical protein